ncbi:FAD/NAD(P)-binding domain-containing protein [Lentinus tigrinus ALCF2SS1-7]|uniref:FAD/NAD(P)-binding domain-containing protein n=1 Tax=Lentinus tigrinus ALCF2SS1-6 TaxID=1328759 RepID=A0A5C2SL39_9APHY|nr:FAD/NAD(P)-binding domain-containing protein [Lentinus tigrinus ALCF2SS1-6]RPD76664.1 FAD/NAD(P)-binding domain-containing protein [Lentinus tigrinus ALCF2SS1-7]
MPTVTRNAALTLDFLVVGGGIGGLAVAYVLSNAGHRVRVLEKRDLNVPSGGHRVPPNFSKILRQWVGEEELHRLSTQCVGSPFLRLSTGENVGYLHWKPAVMAETGGEFLLMHHDDLIRLLYKLATDAGAKVDFHAQVIAVQQGSDDLPNPSVTLASGEVLYADILIGADGSKSLVRDIVLEEEDAPQSGGLTVYTGVVKAEDMVGDPELEPLLMADEFPIWMGEHRAFCGHPVRGRKEFYFGIYSWNNLDGLPQGGEESWEELFPTDQINQENHGPAVQRLIKKVPQVIRTQFMSRPDGIPDWVDATGRIVLLGDAAHPPYPGGSHAGSMAIEDAVVLGSLFSHLRTLDQVPSFLSAYQELRERRCDLVKLGDIKNGKLAAMPNGPAADARDELMRHRVDEWDEGMMKAQFDEIAEIFLYDAGDAAEEWWVNWGRFHHTVRDSVNIDFTGLTSSYQELSV